MIPQAPTQLHLSFDPDLCEQYRSLKECMAARIYAQRGGVTAVAGKLDMRPSHLSEVLGGGGDRGRKFDLDELERYIEAYQDFTPILYLCAKFLGDQHASQAAATARLNEQLQALMETLGQTGVKAKGKARA